MLIPSCRYLKDLQFFLSLKCFFSFFCSFGHVQTHSTLQGGLATSACHRSEFAAGDTSASRQNEQQRSLGQLAAEKHEDLRRYVRVQTQVSRVTQIFEKVGFFFFNCLCCVFTVTLRDNIRFFPTINYF